MPKRHQESEPRSAISYGEVAHWRAVPKEHSFSYPIFSFLLDLDELEAMSFRSRLFGVNRWSVFSIVYADYLSGKGTLREDVERVLREQGREHMPARITLITMPRFFGYVFNPVSFFACFDAEDRIIALITEVHNTFGEAHIYPLTCEPTSVPVEWKFPKEFFVSPFFDLQGEYSLCVESVASELSIRVDLAREGQRVFSATLRGSARPLTLGRLMQTLIRYPLTSLLTMPRIHGQALRLFFRVGACPFEKPQPHHPCTIRSRQNIIHRARLALLSLLRKARESR
jgi:DUF1365 family protein